LAPLVRRVVAVSRQLGDWLVQDVGIAAEKVIVIPNGVDASKFSGHHGRLGLRATSHGYAPADIVVGTVGRLDPVKNQSALIEVASQLAAPYPSLRFAIVGDGREKQALQYEVDRRGLGKRVRLIGHRDDIPEVLKTFDLFVLPSLGEGMCNTILEAMASGLPVVATRVGGNPELVEDGITGRLVAPGDVAALTQAVEFYVRHERLRREHGGAGRARVLRGFTLDAMVQRYAALYEGEVR
jgi:glycosyltransferase involved in cell wall biosynthesis